MDKARFLSDLEVRELSETANSGRGLWDLLSPLGFHSIKARQDIWAPAGTKTDFASIPRLPLAFALVGDRYRAPAANHDHGYDSHQLSRRMTDAVLLEAMGVVDDEIKEKHIPRDRLLGVIDRAWFMYLHAFAWFRRHAIWFAVRLFGWSHW